MDILTEKKCTKCEKIKPITEFHRKAKGKYQPDCKSCKNVYNSNLYLKSKNRKEKLSKLSAVRRKELLAFIKRYKLFCGCKLCGYKKSYYSLEFHHLDATKKDFAISQMRTYGIERAKIEIKKCIVVCSNCHREIHAGVTQINGSVAQLVVALP